MSHYTVLVIGENAEEQLAPFSENIRMDKYSSGVVTEEDKLSFTEFYTVFDEERSLNSGLTTPELEINKTLSFDELYLKYGENWNSERWEKNSEGEWQEMTTYNPKSKWDWYTLGGRWTGFFKLKQNSVGGIGRPGVMTKPATSGYCDCALKKDIDFEFHRNQSMLNAVKRWDLIMPHIVTLPVNDTWEITRSKYPNINEAREMYGLQPRVLKWVELNSVNQNNEDWPFSPFGSGVDEFTVSKETYIKKAVLGSFTTHSVLYNGEWIERGEMGWFGVSHNDMDENKWDEKFNSLIDSLPDDTLLSVYDCHI